MAKKKPVGRPKAGPPMKSLVSLKGTDEFEAWLDDLVDKSESGTRINCLKRALKHFSSSYWVDNPMPKR